MTRVAVVGHIEWVDFLQVPRLPRRGQVTAAEAGFLRAGGGGAVAAVALIELGAEVDFYTALGDDANGHAALAQLEDRGVNVHVAWRDQPTRRAITLLEPDDERTIITLGKRLEPRAGDELDWDQLSHTAAAYFTAGDAGALRHARRTKTVVASPRARHVLESAGVRIDAVVFSEDDRDERTWASRVAARTRLLVATDGARGGRWWGESEGHWDAAALPDKPRDSYGCGDSFAAAFTLGLGRGDSIAQAAALGAQAGALALTRIGPP